MEVELRSYRDGDLDAMVALDALCFTAEFLFDRQSMLDFARARNAITVLAESSEDVLAGLVIVHLERAARSRRGYVVTLDVAPDFRRQGLAGRLMDAAEQQSQAEGAAWMELHVSVINSAAILFYEGRGYVRQSVRRGFYGAGSDAYVYRKDLHAAQS
jgi:ribosomal-protein-alanine N-acetyltransferase